MWSTAQWLQQIGQCAIVMTTIYWWWNKRLQKRKTWASWLKAMTATNTTKASLYHLFCYLDHYFSFLFSLKVTHFNSSCASWEIFILFFFVNHQACYFRNSFTWIFSLIIQIVASNMNHITYFACIFLFIITSSNQAPYRGDSGCGYEVSSFHVIS